MAARPAACLHVCLVDWLALSFLSKLSPIGIFVCFASANVVAKLNQYSCRKRDLGRLKAETKSTLVPLRLTDRTDISQAPIQAAGFHTGMQPNWSLKAFGQSDS